MRTEAGWKNYPVFFGPTEPYRRHPRVSPPFSLCYGLEARIPVEIGVPTLRVEYFNLETNEQGLRNNLDLLGELHDQARIRQVVYN